MKKSSKGRKPVRDKNRQPKEWKPTRTQRGLAPTRYSPYYQFMKSR